MKRNQLLFIFICLVLNLEAQSRILPIIELPSGAKAIGLGGSKIGNTGNASIYGNPTAIFYNHRNSIDYSFGVIPTDSKNTYVFHSLSVGYKKNKNAFFVGGRYLSLGNSRDFMEAYADKKLSFYSHSLDVGYAYAANKSTSFYSSIAYVNEKTFVLTHALRFNVGSYFYGEHILAEKTMNYAIGISISNIGKYFYQEENGFLSPKASIGGTFLFPFSSNQEMTTCVQSNFFIPVSNSKFSSSTSVGIDYSFRKKYSIRVGGSLGDNDNFFAAGLGIKYRKIDVNVGAKLPFRKEVSNIYMFGLALFM